MSVQTELTRITNAKAAVKAAIEGKGVTVPDGTLLDGMAPLIESIETGGSSTPGTPGDITFYDYDGTIVTSWTLAELATKTALPDYPSHNGLICQGWNWTLEAIKSLNRPVTVGAMYITDDGATRLHIRIATVGRMTVSLYIGQTMSNGVSIDWGDGSAAKTVYGTGNVHTSHTYAEPGDYVISLMPQDGCTLSFGNGSSSYCVMGSISNDSIVYCNMLQDVSIGKNVTSISNYAFQNCYSLASVTIPTGVTSIGNYAFSNCTSLASVTIQTGVTSIGDYTFYGCDSLASVTIPTGVTSIGNYAFSNCYSLASVTIPTGVTSISNYAFQNCYSLASVTIPTGVTSIGNYAFSNCTSLASVTIQTGVTSIGDYIFYKCYSLASITIPTGVTSISSNAFNSCESLASVTIPTGVTSIGDATFYGCYSLASITIPTGVTSISKYAFQNCLGMRYYDFSACTAIPALSNTNAFRGIQTDCQMLIPSALYNNWKSATNWATYAKYMVSV